MGPFLSSSKVLYSDNENRRKARMSTFQMPSEISVLKTKAASQKGAGGTNVQTVWPVPKSMSQDVIEIRMSIVSGRGVGAWAGKHF